MEDDKQTTTQQKLGFIIPFTILVIGMAGVGYMMSRNRGMKMK
jgi:hypothetical protein